MIRSGHHRSSSQSIGPFPGFVARSRQEPSSAVTDWRVWADLWHEARSRLAASGDPDRFNRWTGQEPACA